MDFSTALKVSGSGLTAQRMRMNTIASNIANINTTEKGKPYQRRDVRFKAVPESQSFGKVMANSPQKDIHQVHVEEIIKDKRSPLFKYEPDHPDANEMGYVAYPNINLMEEMTNMIQATRSYEANVSAMQASKDMALSALEIGR